MVTFHKKKIIRLQLREFCRYRTIKLKKKQNGLLNTVFTTNNNYDIHCGLSPAQSFSPLMYLEESTAFGINEWFNVMEPLTNISL